MGQKVTLHARKRTVILALVSGSTKQVAADRAGVSRKTVHAWLHDSEFRDEFERIREETAAAELEWIMDFLRERLQARRLALRRLRELIERDDVPIGAQIRILVALLDAEGAAGELQSLLAQKNDQLANELSFMKPVSVDLADAIAEGLAE